MSGCLLQCHSPYTIICLLWHGSKRRGKELEKEAVFYGALLKDAGCTACSAGISAFFPDGEQVPWLDAMFIDPSQFNEVVAWLSRNVPLDSRLPSRIAKFLSFLVQCGPIIKETMRSHCEVAELF